MSDASVIHQIFLLLLANGMLVLKILPEKQTRQEYKYYKVTFYHQMLHSVTRTLPL
jgi:hypothetical protein